MSVFDKIWICFCLIASIGFGIAGIATFFMGTSYCVYMLNIGLSIIFAVGGNQHLIEHRLEMHEKNKVHWHKY